MEDFYRFINEHEFVSLTGSLGGITVSVSGGFDIISNGSRVTPESEDSVFVFCGCEVEQLDPEIFRIRNEYGSLMVEPDEEECLC